MYFSKSFINCRKTWWRYFLIYQKLVSVDTEGWSVDSQSKEYCSLRKSIEESIVLFSQMKEELQRNTLPKEEQLQQSFSTDQSGNDLIDQSAMICIWLWYYVIYSKSSIFFSEWRINYITSFYTWKEV